MTAHSLRLLTLTLVALLLASGCSDRKSAATASGANENASQQTGAAALEDATQDVVKASFAAGGIPTTYTAAFEEGRIKRIAEERKAQGTARRGQYVFYGARLTEYTGAALQSDATLELRFDMQGGLIAASGSSGRPGDSEIDAIRNRAQLLRSHALTRRSVQGHDK